MPAVQFEGELYQIEDGENLLIGLLRHGLDIPNSCQSGACQTCMLRSPASPPPAKSQVGIRKNLAELGYFVSCQCVPTADMEVCRPDADLLTRTIADVTHREDLAPEIIRIRAVPAEKFDFRPGQFVQLQSPHGVSRSYSIASLPDDGYLEFHVRRLPEGQMTGWMFDEVWHGAKLQIAGPCGSCFYYQGTPEKPMLLVGTGTGLSPLIAIARDALAAGHTGEIHLYHGSWNESGLYCSAELRELADQHLNFYYHPCADEAESENVQKGRADQIALAEHPALKGWIVYLCGHPAMVQLTKKKVYLAGASLADIYADPFVICPK
ncbi:MAG: FAD-binding oxidoreductase [Chthonomonadales bacterium]